MDQIHSTTEQHAKGKHLTYDERMIIQIRHKEGCSPNHIAAEIGCAPNTVRNELRRGTIDLYNYVDLGLMETRNHQLPEKLSRRTKHHRNRENKKVLGRSIEERDPGINERTEFGHWECDLVIGQKTGVLRSPVHVL